jgi:hypothetical protein
MSTLLLDLAPAAEYASLKEAVLVRSWQETGVGDINSELPITRVREWVVRNGSGNCDATAELSPSAKKIYDELRREMKKKEGELQGSRRRRQRSNTFVTWEHREEQLRERAATKPAGKKRPRPEKEKIKHSDVARKRSRGQRDGGNGKTMCEGFEEWKCQLCPAYYEEGDDWMGCSSCDWWICQACYASRERRQELETHEAGHADDGEEG